MADKKITAADFRKRLEALSQKTDLGPRLLRSAQFRQLSRSLSQLPGPDRAEAGRRLNQLKHLLMSAKTDDGPGLPVFDPTAPIAVNSSNPAPIKSPETGSLHPITQALDEILSIFSRMGFATIESRQIDSEYYMFDALNFPAGHPARGQFDTFSIDGPSGPRGRLIAPAHTSTMQNRVLVDGRKRLFAAGEPIAVVVPGRVFRNEDIDASHDHMFYQIEGIYVAADVTVAHLIATLKEFMQAYYQQDLDIKIQPFYFPFTEPSFEMAVSCPFCRRRVGGCRVCSQGWIEVLGCGLIHPNVLVAAGIDPEHYSGFAWGIGLMRLVMIKHGIEDIRHFTSSRLEFLEQF